MTAISIALGHFAFTVSTISYYGCHQLRLILNAEQHYLSQAKCMIGRKINVYIFTADKVHGTNFIYLYFHEVI